MIENYFRIIIERIQAGQEVTLQEIAIGIRPLAARYFDENHEPGEHNWYFERFTPIWLYLVERRRYFDAIALWNFAIQTALEWENLNKRNKIHKGTPFYFQGVTGILNNELENGFLAMHQALQEDKRLSGRRIPEAPAFWFVILDFSKQDQFFRSKVEQISTFLSEMLEDYSTSRGGSLTLEQFRRRFLRRRGLSEEVFLFVYSLFKLRKLAFETGKVYKKNVFSSLLHAKLLFDFSVITDKVIENKNPRKGQKLSLKDEMLFLSVRRPAGWPTFNRDDKIGKLNTSFNDDFTGTLYDLLGRKYPSPLSEIENDFAITYGIRNFGAHKIENQRVLYCRTTELAQSILNTLFFTIEKLY